jgi:hypothetical protein
MLGQWFNADTTWMMTDGIHESDMPWIHGDDRQGTGFDPDTVTMCAIVPGSHLGYNGTQ